VMWIGLLFSIMTIELSVEAITDEKPSSIAGHVVRDPQVMIKVFREKTIQCLILADYTQPTPYAIETLLLYFLVDCFSNSASHVGSWMIMGIISRVAMRLGLHRDASHYPNISILRGEMQRRHWALIEHMDLQTSCQVGLPRNIREGMFDTKPPSNLLDEDFDEHCTALPPSRPLSDPTPIAYPLMKHAITRVYGVVVDKTSSIHPISYDEVMSLDSQLNKAYQQVPEALRVYSIEDLCIGAPDLRVRKFSLDLCYQRARCVLHRRFLVILKSSVITPYWYSAKVCVDAAMQILQSQAIIYAETRPGKALCDQQWKLSSLMTHDYLLAAMLICLYLSHTAAESPTGVEASSDQLPIIWSRDELLCALEKSQKISEEASNVSKDAAKVSKALKLLLSRLRGSEQSVLMPGAQLSHGIASPPPTNGSSPNGEYFERPK
jgi:hypothetical protein